MLSFDTLAVTDTEAQVYVDSRGYSGWPDTSVDRMSALRRGQDYVAREYNDRWILEFENDSAPDLIKYAIFESSLVEARNPGVLSPSVKASDAKMLTNVKGIQWTPIPGPSGVEALRPRLLHIESLLRCMIKRPTLLLNRA